MNHRTTIAIAFTLVFTAAAAVVPTAQAGNVAWGVSVGVPGLSVSAGQPGVYGGYHGGRGYYRAPYYPVARPYYRPYVRPYAPYVYRPVVVVPQAPYYYAPPVTYPSYPSYPSYSSY